MAARVGQVVEAPEVVFVPRVRKRRASSTPLEVLGLIAICALATVFLTPSFTRARSSAPLSGCGTHLKKIGTAMEMYSMDNNDKYPPPPEKSYLTPNYLETIPECHCAERDSYVFERGPTATYNTDGYQDYYFVYCSGTNHSTAPPNYPQYNGIVGLIER